MCVSCVVCNICMWCGVPHFIVGQVSLVVGTMTQTIISVSVRSVLATFDPILYFTLSILIRKNENIYILYQRTLEYFYGNIAYVPVLH